MSTTIDQKVVEMRFDNRDFERNVSETMSTLEKFKQKLSLDGASKGLESVSEAAKRVDMSGLSTAVETVCTKFSALQIAGITAISNITNSAVDAGKRFAKSLTIDQVTAGMNKYEQKTSSVQTIMNSTGKSIDEVNEYLARLMWFSDETSYGFTDMTSALGQMTSSGGDIDKLIPLITGVANATAYAGKGASEFSRVMYNLNQSYGAGYLQLMDWKSVELAGVGSKQLKETIIKTAEDLGKIKKGEVTIGNFAETLKNKWADTEVMEAAFGKFGEFSDAIYSMVENGEADTAAEAIEKLSGKYDELGVKAFKSAQEAKTFSEAIDATKDAVSSGWLNTFEIIFGNYEEAKVLWTDLANALWETFASGAEARNELLTEWKELGGRDDLIESFWNVWEAIRSIVKPIKEAFGDIFPPVTAKNLATITENLKKFTESLALTSETSEKVKRIFKGIFSIFDIVRKVIVVVTESLFGLSQSKGITDFSEMILDSIASIADFFTSLNESFDTDGLAGVMSRVGSGISKFFEFVTDGFSGLDDFLGPIGKSIWNVIGKIFSVVKDVFTWISDNVSAGDIFAGLAGGGIFVMAKKFADVADKIKGGIDGIFSIFDTEKGEGLKDRFNNILESVNGALKNFTTGIKIWSIVGIAVSVGILAHSLKTISELKVFDISKAIGAIGILLTELMISFKSMTKTLSKNDSKGLITSAISLILVATAVNILVGAISKVSDLSMEQIGKGLAAIGGALIELCACVKIIGSTKTSLSTAITIVALAYSCVVLADALKKFGEMSWDEIGRGLTAMGGALAEITAVTAVMGKVGGFSSLFGAASIWVVVQGLDDLADALKKFGEMSWEEIGKGLTAMGGALAEIGVITGALGYLAGFASLFGAGSILIVIQGLDDLVEALKKFAEMSWEEIGKGLTAMGGALAEIGVITGALGYLAGFASLFGAGSILLVVQGLDEIAEVMKKFAEMSWDEIGRGLTAMGGALAEIGVITGALGYLAGFAGIIGAGSILLVVQGLADIADALKKFGEMSWEEIGKGLTAMGGALAEIGVVTGALGYLTGFAGLIGGGSILLVVQGLGDIADALKKFGEMSWEEIQTGLAAMGGALSEIALGGFINTLSILGSVSLSTVAEPLGILADSVKKWVGVEIPDNLSLELAKLAEGIYCFTFDGLGASAISTVAEPLGSLADSVQKWIDVDVPDGIGTQLSELADAVLSFTFSSIGAESIATVAEPLGALSESVQKWADVKIPETLTDDLVSLADGILAFTWGFMGGWSLDTIIEPLAELPATINKWNDVRIPDTISEDLTTLSEGILSLTWGFMGGWSLDTIIEPLSELRDVVVDWAGIEASDDIEDTLTGISNGISSFGLLDMATISVIADDLVTFSTAFKNLSCITTDGDDISDFADNLDDAIDTLSDIDEATVTDVTSIIKKIYNRLDEMTEIDYDSVDKFLAAVDELNEIDLSDIAVDQELLNKTVGHLLGILTRMSETITHEGVSLYDSMYTVMTGLSTAITDSEIILVQEVAGLIDAMCEIILMGERPMSTDLGTLVTKASSGITDNASSFETAGGDLGDGLVNGINSKQQAVYNAGYALGQKAVQGEKDGQKSKSPSKLTTIAGKWIGEGLIIGMDAMLRSVYKSGYGLGETATSSISETISQISDIVDRDIDAQPTIRPVLDLSDVKSGVGTLGGMLNFGPSVDVLANVGAINMAMNRRIQNGATNDVVTAIKNLGKDLGSMERNSYNINGINYTEGDDVSEALQTIVRAAVRERRA